ncbi:MAG: hypothetical protein V2I33_12030 [Kangiellaceae bacterium]|nr:hypothetical protein [Kangiellaceae bacterium]
MKKIVSTAILLLTLAGCGGGSDSNESNNGAGGANTDKFNLVLRDLKDCGSFPLPNQKVLIYDESPLQNPNSSFTEYTTDASGQVSIDVEPGSKVSVTAIVNDVSGNLERIYSFLDLSAGNYDASVRFSNPIEGCSCSQVGVDVLLGSGLTINDIAEISVQSSSFGTTRNNPDSLAFSLDVCEGNERRLSAFARTFNDEIYFGTVVPSINTTEITMAVDRSSNTLPVPSFLGAEDIFRHQLNVNGTRYGPSGKSLVDSSVYPVLNGHSATSSVFTSESSITSTNFDDINTNNTSISINGVIVQRDEQSSRDASNLSLRMDATDVNVYRSNNDLTVQTISDETISTDIMGNFIFIDAPAIGFTPWYVYSPVVDTLTFPQLDQATTELLDQRQTVWQFVSKIDVSGTDDFSTAINQRRFNDELGNSLYDIRRFSDSYFQVSIADPLGEAKTSYQRQIHKALEHEGFKAK